MNSKRDFTDLAKLIAPSYCFQHGPHTKDKVERSGECVFQDPKTGELVGNIYTFIAHNNKINGTFNGTLLNELTQLGMRVGRIWAVYDDDEEQSWVGTGFLVSNNIVLTARHVVKDEHEIPHQQSTRTIKYTRAYFTTRVTGDSDEVSENDDDVYQLERLNHFVDTLPEFKRFFRMDGGVQAFIDDDSWEYSNDFAFLKLSRPHTAGYVLPREVSDLGDKRVFVVGYPAYIGENKFVEAYTSTSTDVEQKRKLYKVVSSQMKGFQKKILSTGLPSTLQHSEGFSGHRCPTLRGTSGGLVNILEEGVAAKYFIGVHVGGALSMENNFMIAVQRPEFVLEYCKHVCSDAAFVEENRQHLSEYLKPHMDVILKYIPSFTL